MTSSCSFQAAEVTGHSLLLQPRLGARLMKLTLSLFFFPHLAAMPTDSNADPAAWAQQPVFAKLHSFFAADEHGGQTLKGGGGPRPTAQRSFR